MKSRPVMIVAAIIGGLLPLRPFFFTSPTDPATETIDLIISPAYILGRALPPMGDLGSGALLLSY
jgi:VIT1/CCC1 family predicted Fe2+/Mn2+ transporter